MFITITCIALRHTCPRVNRPPYQSNYRTREKICSTDSTELKQKTHIDLWGLEITPLAARFFHVGSLSNNSLHPKILTFIRINDCLIISSAALRVISNNSNHPPFNKLIMRFNWKRVILNWRPQKLISYPSHWFHVGQQQQKLKNHQLAKNLGYPNSTAMSHPPNSSSPKQPCIWILKLQTVAETSYPTTTFQAITKIKMKQVCFPLTYKNIASWNRPPPSKLQYTLNPSTTVNQTCAYCHRFLIEYDAQNIHICIQIMVFRLLDARESNATAI